MDTLLKNSWLLCIALAVAAGVAFFFRNPISYLEGGTPVETYWSLAAALYAVAALMLLPPLWSARVLENRMSRYTRLGIAFAIAFVATLALAVKTYSIKIETSPAATAQT
jgi:hypothetical protein